MADAAATLAAGTQEHVAVEVAFFALWLFAATWIPFEYVENVVAWGAG